MRTDLEVAGHTHPDPDTWILHFGWEKNPLPMNGSYGHWRPHARKVRTIRTQALRLAELAGIPPLGRCRAQLTWWVTTNHVRDPDNLASLEKPLFDALVRARIVADDRPELMDKPRGRIRHIHDADGLVTDRCFTLTITRLPEERP